LRQPEPWEHAVFKADHGADPVAGVDGLWSMYQWLDRAPKGRNETGIWWRRHDEYDKP